MPRKNVKQFNFRLSDKVEALMDALRPTVGEALGGLTLTRVDVLLLGLEELRKKHMPEWKFQAETEEGD